MKFRKYILLLFTSLTLSIHAQEPSHFTIGQEKLIGLDIYDLHQDRQLNYWITTNNGLFKFDGYNFTEFPCIGMLGNSLFNLTEDQDGNIYCSNLNGQLFKINELGCKLYYTIPDSLVGRNISFNFDDQNRLIVFSKEIFQVTEDKKPALLYDNYFYSHSRVYKTSKNKLVSYNSGQGDLITIENGKIKSLEVEIDNKLITPKIIEFENQLIIYNRSTLKQLSDSFNSTKFELPKMKTARNDYRLYSDGKSMWIANLTGGGYYYKDTSYFSEPTNLIFENSIISCYLKDHEGNTLLGTFGKGIIVIPNTGFKDIHLENTNSEVNKVTKMNDKSLIFGTQAGEIIKRDSLGKTTKIVSQGIKRIELLKNIPELDALFFNGKKNTLTCYRNNTLLDVLKSDIKDICFLEDQHFLMISNAHLHWINSNDFKILKSKKFNYRPYSVAYDSINKSIYTGTVLGLIINKLDDYRFYRHEEKVVMSEDIKSYKGKVYVTTKKYGLLIFQNDSLIDKWSTSTGLLSNQINQIKFYENDIFLATNKGINRLSTNGEVKQFINYTNGLNAKNILDFEINNNELWIVTNKGVQSILLSEIRNNAYTPNLELCKVLVNDEPIDTAQHTFKYEHNKFVFEIASKTLKYRNDIFYEYQLVGVDKDWITNAYLSNTFEYKSLPPNNYTFKVRAVYGDNYSDTIEYRFVIQKPFWLKTSFFILAAIIVLLIVFITLYIQIRKQKAKLTIENQFNIAQLTALKSQMNPHFIFNSLNSIQDLILQQDKENAYNYISRFALLVRKILSHSDNEFIDFEEEVQVLSIYLELEELRFKNDFSFEIKTNDIKDIEIPPMIIQPFIENALKHGLLHKKGHKKLKVEFAFENETLVCKIEDNGVGRQKSNEIKQRQNKIHESFSVKSIKTRFEILKELYGQNVGLEYKDLKDGDVIEGTLVTLKIPYKRKF